MEVKKNLICLSIGILSLWLAHCAGQIPPSGGPADTTAPFILRTLPDTNAVNIKPEVIEVEFNEYVDRRSLEESIFISPYVGNLEFDWGGTDVTIHFSEPLRERRTYVMNVGTDVVDLRAGNRMAKGFTLAFSTGDSIDRGFVSGQVFDEKPEGVMVFAYLLAGMNPDTLDPGRIRPDYIMQTGKDGAFTLANMALGMYRLFAVRDEYRDLIYTRQIDQFGVTSGDIAVTPDHPRIDNVLFMLSREDTTKPFLTSVQSIDRDKLLIKFNEPIDSVSFSRATFSLEDTLKSDRIDTKLVSLNRTFSSAYLITVSHLDSGNAYRLTVIGLSDIAGNPIDSPNNRYVFQGNSQPDTSRPVLSFVGIKDSTRGAPLDQQIIASFSEPVSQMPVASAIVLSDSTRKPVTCNFTWLNATDLVFAPRHELSGKSWYKLSMVMDSISDLQGNGYRDSLVVVRFETADMRNTGVIEGTVFDEKKEEGSVFLSAASVGLAPMVKKTLRLKGPGRFLLDRIPEGSYTLSAFRDADSSGSYSFGRPYPFVPAERFIAQQDTLRVRARWSVEGVLVRMK